MEQLPTLYKYSTTGALQQWSIEVVDNAYRTHSGQVGGKITTTAWTVCEGKNIGKANSTNAQQQAWADATSKWNKKVDREQFVESIEDVNVVKFVQPMLAQKYEDRKHQLNFQQGVWVQCKLNGARCVASKHGLFSRKGSKWESVPHIEQALASFFERHPDVVLDGELFNNDLRQDLGGIISLISKKNINQDIIEKSKNSIQFHVYDIVDPSKDFAERLDLLNTYINHEICSDVIKDVMSIPVDGLQHIDQFLQKFEAEGHEGVIVRTNGKYECKRSKHLLKYKSFVDDEFDIVDIIEGVGNLTNKVGAFILMDSRGMTFNSAPTGSHQYWEQMWSDRHQLKGKKATVKYKELTPVKIVNGKPSGGVPSFGKVVAIRDYES